MSRVCEITGKKPMVGNNVSHSKKRTKRRFDINLQDASFFSEGLKRQIKLEATVHGIRIVEHKGGIDAFLLDTAPTKLQSAKLRKARKALLSVLGEQPKPQPRKRYPSAKDKRTGKAGEKAA